MPYGRPNGHNRRPEVSPAGSWAAAFLLLLLGGPGIFLHVFFCALCFFRLFYLVVLYILYLCILHTLIKSSPVVLGSSAVVPAVRLTNIVIHRAL